MRLADMTKYYDNHGGKIQVVECGRLLAAISIVWLHTVGAVGFLPFENSARWARWAVPFFLAASIWFSNPRKEGESPWKFFMSRFLRLYPVFLIWNLFYLAFRLISGNLMHHPLDLHDGNFLRVLFLDGFALQLWFLPFLLLVDIGQAVVAFLRLSEALLAIISMVGLLLIVIFNPYHSDFLPHGRYLLQMTWYSIPALLWAIVLLPLVRWLLEKKDLNQKVALGFAVTGILITWYSTCGSRNPVVEGLSGILIFIAFLLIGKCWKNNIPQWIQEIAATSAGIYLVHVLFIYVLHHLAVARHIQIISKSGVIIIFLLSLVISCASIKAINSMGFSWLLSGFKSPRKRFVTPERR